jgi:hypothetical protein
VAPFPLPLAILTYQIPYEFLYLNHNNFTFDGMELIAQKFSKTALYSPQKNIPTHQNGNTLSVSAGGTLSNNTYHWFKCEGTTPIHVATIKGDSVFSSIRKRKVPRSGLKLCCYRNLNFLPNCMTTLLPNNTPIASAENGLQQYGKPNIFSVYSQSCKRCIECKNE